MTEVKLCNDSAGRNRGKLETIGSLKEQRHQHQVAEIHELCAVVNKARLYRAPLQSVLPVAGSECCVQEQRASRGSFFYEVLNEPSFKEFCVDPPIGTKPYLVPGTSSLVHAGIRFIAL